MTDNTTNNQWMLTFQQKYQKYMPELSLDLNFNPDNVSLIKDNSGNITGVSHVGDGYQYSLYPGSNGTTNYTFTTNLGLNPVTGKPSSTATSGKFDAAKIDELVTNAKNLGTKYTGDPKDKNAKFKHNLGKWAQFANAALDIGKSLGLNADRDVNSNDAFAANLRGTAENVAMQFGPWGMAGAAASKLVGMTGGYSDASKGLGGFNDTANMVASIALPGAGWFAGKTKKVYQDRDVAASSGYSGVNAYTTDQMANANAKILFGKGKANERITEANLLNTMAGNVLAEQKLINQGMSANTDMTSRDLYKDLAGGGFSHIAAKQGAKLYNRQDAQRLLKCQGGNKIPEDQGYQEWLKTVQPSFRSLEEYDLQAAYKYLPKDELDAWVQDPENNHLKSVVLLDNGDYMFLKLGTLGIGHPSLIHELETYFTNQNGLRDTHDLVYDRDRYYYRKKNPTKYQQGGSFNIIPAGALHKNKHHLEEIDDKFKEVTHKGIPVISESAVGEITQHAEVEREEWTIRIELTKQLEDLYHKYENSDNASEKDELAYQAGDLIVKELLYNTNDNTGLISKVNPS